MMNIEKRQVIDSSKLNGGAYFTSIVQEAYACGLLNASELEKLQMECISFLAYKSERYNMGDSSSIRVEKAESIMKSILYTIGLYLKSLPDADTAAWELKSAKVPEMYQEGRKLIDTRLRAAKGLYRLADKNRLITPNYTYNATLSDNGIGSFFKGYDPDYEAHETSASIDYQLCNPVAGLEGVEYIQKYLSRLYIENEFCNKFAQEDIHHLLSGYDSGYKDLLLNIFEQVLTGAIGCRLAGRNAGKLDISRTEVQCLYIKLSELDEVTMASEIRKAAGEVLAELGITNPPVKSYVAKSLPKITAGVTCAVKTDTLEKIFAAPVDSELKPGIGFLPGSKMDNGDYRKLIEELLSCRFVEDKLAVIKEKVKSFGDFEDILIDAQLNEEETYAVLNIAGDIELAALIKHHPFISDIQAVDLPESEQKLRGCLESYLGGLASDRRLQLIEMAGQLIDY